MARVLLFAAARDRVGAPAAELRLPEQATVADVRAELLSAFPALAGLAEHLLFAVDNEYADDRHVLTPESQIACFPPVSGG